MHPLLPVLLDAIAGRFPAADGAVEVMPPDADGTRAVASFTGHAFVLAEVDPSQLLANGADGFGGALHPDVVRWLAGPGGEIGSTDVVLSRIAVGGPTLPRRDDLDAHPRVMRAQRHRRDVAVHGDDTGMVVIGRGLVGRWEVSVELLGASNPGGGAGRRLIAAGLAALPAGEPCFAQVSPGNAASLRAFLAAGFVPIGSEVLITTRTSRGHP